MTQKFSMPTIKFNCQVKKKKKLKDQKTKIKIPQHL